MSYLEAYNVLRSIMPPSTALTLPLPEVDRKKLISLLRHNSVNEVLQGLRYTDIVYRLNDCICIWHIDTMVVLAHDHIDVYKKNGLLLHRYNNINNIADIQMYEYRIYELINIYQRCACFILTK